MYRTLLIRGGGGGNETFLEITVIGVCFCFGKYLAKAADIKQITTITINLVSLIINKVLVNNKVMPDLRVFLWH